MRRTCIRLLPLPLALLGLDATAEDDFGMAYVRELSRPNSSVAVGLGGNSDDPVLTNRDNGRDDNGLYPQLDFDINRRDEETGTWTLIDGRRVGQSNRHLRYERNRQGQWKYFLEFEQLETASPLLYDTQLQGLGSSDQRLGAQRQGLALEQDRTNFRLGMGRHFTDHLEFNLSYRHEDKEGDRGWGVSRFTSTGSQSFFLVEPIDYLTRELDASLNYVLDDLQLQAGYRLSLFDNSTNDVSLDISTLDAGAADLNLSTPPDNHSQLFYLQGGYHISPLSRASFKVSFQQDTQDDDFTTANPFNQRTDLGGEIDTLRLRFGLMSRPIPALTLRARLKYEDRDDQTPQAIYVPGSGQLNPLTSRSRAEASVEANYRLDSGLRLEGSAAYEDRDHAEVPDANMARRDENQESRLGVGLRKQLTPKLDASLRLTHANRVGSEWQPGSGIQSGTLLSNPVQQDFVHSIQFADRRQNQGRLVFNWQATDKLSLQWLNEVARNSYDGLTLGPDEGRDALSSLDANYRLSDEWQLNGWVTLSYDRLERTTRGWQDLDPNNFATRYQDSRQIWAGESRNRGQALGLGVRGLTDDEIKLGADLEYSDDRYEFDMNSLSPPSNPAFAPATALPDIDYQRVQLKAFAEFPLEEKQGLRLDYRFDHVDNSDWTWNNHQAYATTQVDLAGSETNHFVGLTYYYRGW